MDKRIENAMNELINTEIWSTGLYLSLQVYFEDETVPASVPRQCLLVVSVSSWQKWKCGKTDELPNCKQIFTRYFL